jgi:hypothetical protein
MTQLPGRTEGNTHDSGNKILNFSSMILGSDNKDSGKTTEHRGANLFDSFRDNTAVKSNTYSTYLKQVKTDEAGIADIITYASTLFDLKEYMKCNHVLRSYALPKYSTAMFIYYYSEYLIIQQKKQEEYMDNSEAGLKYSNSKDLYKLYQGLKLHDLGGNPFMLYLYGVILKELNMLQEAKVILLKSLNLFPFLWSAWVEITLICRQNELIVNILIKFRKLHLANSMTIG